MKKIFVNASKKSIAVLIAFVMVLPLIFTGCDVREILEDLAADGILISVNHEMLTESYKNEPIYTYRIDATVTNNYVVDLYDAEVTLDVPEGVEIIDGKPKTKEKISCGDENVYSYTWKVSVEPTVEDRNLDYSVSVSSRLITTVSSFESIFVEGKNENDNRLDFSVDTWNFRNYTARPIPITQEDYDALFLDLNNTERATIKEHINNGAGGQCYGMAVTTILAKSGRIDLNRLQADAADLHSVSKNKEAKSTIAYYYLTQLINPAKDKITQYIKKDNGQKLKELIDLSNNVEKGGSPVLLCFYLNGGGGHAVVAFGCETCKETYDGITYNNRILIYDNNFPRDFEYLYYNDSGDWEILYKDRRDRLNKPYDTSSLGLITASMELIDISNIEQNRKSVYSYITSRNNSNIEISSNETTWKVNGTDTNGAENVVAYYDIDAVDTTNLNIAIVKGTGEAAYTVRSQDDMQDLDVSINYDNYYISAEADGDDEISFDPAGSVDIKGETADVRLSITANDGYAPFDWSTVFVDAKNGTNPKLEVTDEGYILSGDELSGVSIYAENETTANQLTFSMKEATVLIARDGENLCVRSDKDEDGQYETVLATGKAAKPLDPMSGGSVFGFGSVNLWMIVIIAGVLLATATVAVIIIICRSKKNKKKKKRS